jgi:hypothetical protein
MDWNAVRLKSESRPIWPGIRKLVEENGLDTPGNFQWALSIIAAMDLAHEFYLPPNSTS